MDGAEDEFRGGHLGQVVEEGCFPGSWGCSNVVGGGRHGAEEAVEAEVGRRDRSYGR